MARLYLDLSKQEHRKTNAHIVHVEETVNEIGTILDPNRTVRFFALHDKNTGEELCVNVDYIVTVRP